MLNTGMSRKFLDRMFRRIDGIVWDLSSGKIGIKDQNGIYTLTETSTGPETTSSVAYGVSVNPFDNFGFGLPAFATQVSRDQIALGDLLVGDKGIHGWIVEKLDVAFRVIDKQGQVKTINPPKVTVMNNDGILIVRTLNNLAGGDQGFGTLQGSLMPLLMMSDTADIDFESIMPLILFTSQGQGGANALQSMLPMLLLTGGLKGGRGGAFDKLLPLMMMGGFGGAQGGMNPMMLMAMSGGLDSLTGGNNAVPAANANQIGGFPALQPLRR